MAVRTSCELVGLSRSAWSKPVRDWLEYDRELIEALQELVVLYNRWGFWKYHDRLRLDGRHGITRGFAGCTGSSA
jgi:putative transposase